jgi:hypothetical protein
MGHAATYHGCLMLSAALVHVLADYTRGEQAGPAEHVWSTPESVFVRRKCSGAC